MSKPKRNREDFMFMKKEGERLVKLPGSLNGLDFVLDTIKNCTVFILDRTAQITADEINDSKLYIGPVEGSIFLRDCHNCTISVVCRQFRLKNCTNLTIFLHSASDPSIELSSDLRFAPFNFKYPLLDQQVQAAGMDVSVNFWSQIFDFNAKPDEAHWSVLEPTQFYLEAFDEEVEGGGEAVNPFPRPSIYGGSITDEIVIGSQQQPGMHGGMMSFSLSTSQAQAEAEIHEVASITPPTKQGESPSKQVSDPFGTQPSNDFFGSGANPNDPFAPSQSDPFAPSQADPFSQPQADPFSQPQADPFSQPQADPFSQHQDDPFSHPHSADSFGSSHEQQFMSSSSAPVLTQPFISGQPVVAQTGFFDAEPVEDTSEEDAEQAELKRLRDAENQERMRLIYEKEEDERRLKDERRREGREQLNQWNADRQKQIALRKELNREQQRSSTSQKATETSWKKVASMVDFKDTGDRKDLGRMRGVLLTQKNK